MIATHFKVDGLKRRADQPLVPGSRVSEEPQANAFQLMHNSA